MPLARKVERFIRTSGMKPTRFGIACANDPRLVFDLRRGRTPGARLSARIEAFIAAASGTKSEQ